MAYVYGNPKSKAELKRRFESGEELAVYQPGGLFPLRVGAGGIVALEGPHFPKAHSWYVQVRVNDELIITEIL